MALAVSIKTRRYFSMGFLILCLQTSSEKFPALSERARLAQSVEHQTFNLRVAGSSPSSGEQVYFFFTFYNI